MPRSILSQARRSQPRCRTPIPTISSAPMSRGSKTISASRSTSRRSPKSSAALRPIPATPATTDPMQIEPSETAFAERYGRGQAQVVWTTLVADLETPVSAFLKLGGGKPMSFLLESVAGGDTRGRHSIIGIDPDLIWRANGARAEVNRSTRSKPDAFVPCPEPPLKALRTLIAESRIELPENLPPMAAGVFGYLGYDMVRLMEELPPPNPDPIGIPDAVLVRPTIIVVFDAVKDSITVVTPVRPDKCIDAKTALTRAVERLSGVVESLDRPLDMSLAEYDEGPLDVPSKSNTTPDEYTEMVAKAKDYITARSEERRVGKECR